MMRIGMRKVKTIISILICLLIFIVLKLIASKTSNPDWAYYWYNPFFAGIATAYSIHNNRKKSFEQASNRCVASLIGGLTGATLILVYKFVCNGILGLDVSWPTISSSARELIVPYILTALSSVIVINIGVKLNKQGAIFVGILTLLSVTVSPNATITKSIGEIGFAFNRILSTIIGVCVALGVNLFKLPRRYKNDNLLFAIGIDGIVYSRLDKIKGYVNYKINYFADNKINTTLFTTRTPTTFMHLLDDVEVTHPIICMGGAALYDAKKLEYVGMETIPVEAEKVLDEYLKDLNITPFKNYIIDNVLSTYCEKLDNNGEIFYANEKKNAPYCDFHLGANNTEYQDLIYYILIEENDVADKVCNYINEKLSDILYAMEIDAFNADGKCDKVKYVKIYSKKILELNIVKEYCKENNLQLVGMSSSKLSKYLLDNSEVKVATYDYDNAIVVDRFDIMVRKVTSIYHNKKYHKRK